MFTAVCLAVIVGLEAIWLYLTIVQSWGTAQDYFFYRGIGARWLADGSYYLPNQLAGPYGITALQEVLYPPNSLLVFVPLALVPWPLWWIIPIGVTLYVVRKLDPAPWTWVVMLVLLAYPRAIGAFLFGNSDMWAMAGIAAALLWGWPAVLLALKPTLAPLALLGVRRRSWWVAGVALGLASLAMLPLWFDYLTAMRNVYGSLDYSVGSLPLMAIPVVAWAGRRRSG